jgi:hypothetical protein
MEIKENSMKKHQLLYLFHKCSMLYTHISKEGQRDTLDQIQLFIQKVESYFQKTDFQNSEEKREKIFSLILPFFEKLTSQRMPSHIHMNQERKDFLLKEIDISSLSYARTHIQDDDSLLPSAPHSSGMGARKVEMNDNQLVKKIEIEV